MTSPRHHLKWYKESEDQTFLICHGGQKVKGISRQCLLKVYFQTSILVATLLATSSCSWISSRRSLFGDNEDEAASKTQSTVSKAQYDELLKKYERLQKGSRIENTKDPKAMNQMLNQMESSNQEQLLADLNNVSDKSPDLAETVDVFAKTQEAGNTAVMTAGPSALDPQMVEGQIEQIRKASTLIRENKLDAGLRIVKTLESSPIRQISVRAKYLLGEILFRQGEFDLAMQMYEEILKKHAFSGVVIKSLGRLIVCAEKLKIDAKKEKYYSILHDFFEQGA